MKVDWRAVQKYDRNTKEMARKRKMQRIYGRVYVECETTTDMQWCESNERLENRRQMFRTMQATRTHKHGARGGHDKATLPTVTSVKRFENSRLTCVYKHK